MVVCEGALTEPLVHEMEVPGLGEAKGPGPAPPLHSPTNISLKTYLNGEAKAPLPPARAVSQDPPPIPARAHGAGTTVPISQIERRHCAWHSARSSAVSTATRLARIPLRWLSP